MNSHAGRQAAGTHPHNWVSNLRTGIFGDHALPDGAEAVEVPQLELSVARHEELPLLFIRPLKPPSTACAHNYQTGSDRM
jgi:hypothetical protein